MSKVLVVDREDIEAVRNTLANGGQAIAVLRWAKNILARPSEVEGAVQCPASHPAECYAPGTQVVHASLVHGIVRQADQYHAALSAVTAERDALLAEREGKVLVPVEPIIE